MALPLGHGQTVHERPDAACEHRIAVDHEMVRRDGGANGPLGVLHVVHGFRGRDVLQDDPQRREIGSQLNKNPVYERLSPVENVCFLVGYLAMYQERYADRLHPLQYPEDPPNIRHAGG